MKSKSLLLLITILKIVKLQKFDGDSCELPNGTHGKCTKIDQCSKAVQALKIGIPPTTCGFDENDPIVCCSVEESTKSEAMCKLYSERVLMYQVHSIVGGSDATPAEFPHMAALGFGTKENIEWGCGGSLISDRFVLTAGHCTHDQEKGDVKFVRIGGARLDSSSIELQNFEVTKRVRHPEYKPPIVYNDIALLELDRPAIFGYFVKPACLHSKSQLPESPLTATGWGLTQHAGSPSLILQKVRLQVFNHTQCASVYKSLSVRKLPNGILGDRQVCAGSHDEKDTCQGDSGGPLQSYRYDVGLYDIIGVTAFGKVCGTPDVPSVYSKVAFYLPWIETIVWPN